MNDATGQTSILVVDDDARIAASIRRALLYEGYEVALAVDGPAALADGYRPVGEMTPEAVT